MEAITYNLLFGLPVQLRLIPVQDVIRIVMRGKEAHIKHLGPSSLRRACQGRSTPE
jgi:hypothetical protein